MCTANPACTPRIKTGLRGRSERSRPLTVEAQLDATGRNAKESKEKRGGRSRRAECDGTAGSEVDAGGDFDLTRRVEEAAGVRVVGNTE